MRRMGHACLPPSINHSEAEFDVEPLRAPAKAGALAASAAASDTTLLPSQEHGYAVRYALGALKGVGEKAMEQLVEERRLNGKFASLDDFAARIDPRLLNRRQIESLAGGGAFDEIAERWQASAAAETILSAAASAADARTSGQGGLFGEGPANVVPIRMPTGENWTLAQRMAAEKESFGFYFSAHPVDNYRHLARANGAKTFAELAAMPGPADGSRYPGTMAGLVEDTRFRTSAKGRRYMMATLSDSSGQFEATVFDDQVAEQVANAAKAGQCALLGVELDRRPGEETPRVTIKSLSGFDNLARRTRLQIEVEVEDEAALRLLAEETAQAHGGTGQLLMKASLTIGEASLVLCRDLLADAELAARIERIPGIAAVRLGVADPPRLALVS
jgi:DNA polymerase-3 subunit alpha